MDIKLLTSEKAVKALTSIDDNTATKYLVPCIVEAQRVGLQGFTGSALYDKLIENAFDGHGGVNAYDRLTDQAQMYLAYKAITELIPRVSYKITNTGLIKTADTNESNASEGEIMRARAFYMAKADAAALELQRYMCEHRAELPELAESNYKRMKKNLYSAATCGIFLGGARGKRF